MKAHSFSIFLITLAIISAIILPSNSTAVPPNSEVIVRVGVYENPPKIFTDEHGTVAGFWPDLMEEIARTEHWTIEYVPGSWNEGLDRLVLGEIDIMPDVAFTEERAQRFFFSDAPVLMSWSRLYIHKNAPEFHSIHDLSGKKVGALRNSVNLNGPSGFREMIKNFNLELELVELENYHEVFMAVKNGEVYAGITNRNFGNQNMDQYELNNTPVIFQPINIKFAFPPNFNAESNICAAINNLMRENQDNDDSVYYNLLTEYFETEIAEKRVEVLPGYLTKILVAIGGLLVFLGTIVLVSRVQVRRQTHQIRQQNKALQASEQQYREILNSPSDVIFIHDAETGKVLDVNDAIEEMYGFRPKEIPDLPFSALCSERAPYTFEAAVGMMKKSITHGPQVFEWEASKKNGEAFWVEVALRYSKIQGQGRIIAVVRDINERKLLDDELAAEQERLRVTLRSIGDAVITTDLAGNIVLVNKVAEDLTEWPQDEALGKKLSEVFHIVDGKTGKPLESPFKKVIDSGTIQGLNENTVLISRNGKHLTVADSGAPICDRNSKIMGMVLVFRDITNQIRMEEEILKVKKLESVGVLAGGIAHDFNNILSAIMGNINLVSVIDGQDSESAPLLDDAEKAVVRATKLTKQLLTFSKGGDPVMEVASASKIIAESADFVLRGSSVACSFDFPENLWLLKADSGQISQVIQNLVLNARDAMPEGGTIKIVCSNCSECALPHLLDPNENDFVKITIQDSGIGMPAGLLGKIFDPFFSTKKQGSGLGLAITHSIIIKHGGHILVDSTPGEGTRFTLYLPIADDPEIIRKEEKTSDPIKDSAKILVMDDQEMLRNVFRSMLEHMGHEVVLVEDGEGAINACREHHEAGNPFDLVILDLTIPGGMGGADAGQAILKDLPHTNILVSSGYSIDPVIANYRDYGFKGALVKPLRFSDLKNLIESTLRTDPAH